MTRTEELLKLCEEAKEIASAGIEKPWQVREVKLAEACKQIIALVRLQHEALKHSNPSTPIWKTPHKQAIEAFYKFEMEVA